MELHVTKGMGHRSFSGTEYSLFPLFKPQPHQKLTYRYNLPFSLAVLIFLYFHVMYKLKRPMMIVNGEQAVIFVLEKAAISTKKKQDNKQQSLGLTHTKRTGIFKCI